MKTLWIEKEEAYDGRQLHSLHGYLKHKVLGDSVISWVGACQVDVAHMIDGEDLLAGEKICGSQMLHFICEIFDRDLFAGVALQRLMASLAKDVIEERKTSIRLQRKGDDLYFDKRKLSISIATSTPVSTILHFAMNVSNEGTPVPTCALQDDFALSPKEIASELMKRFASEYEDILIATKKVRPAP